MAGSPLYVFAARPVAERIAEMDGELVAAGFRLGGKNPKSPVTARHWLSCKTQPLQPLLEWWRGTARGIEVVSEVELRLALAAGYAPADILANGPAKHHWLGAFDLSGLAVNFDSVAELRALLPVARKRAWRCGVRVLTGEEHDPEFPDCPTQFGMTPEEAVVSLKRLARAGSRVESVHFHLRSNVASVAVFERAIAEVAGVCRAAAVWPRCLDIGGGVPVRQVLTRGGKVYDGEFGLRSFARMLRQGVKLFPGMEELWLENGRFVTSGSGALVVKVLDVKERRGVRQFICDGGRTLHALMSVWEQHALVPLAAKTGPEVLTVVHGPTCMAFDQLARVPLPRTVKAGDYLLWLDAGAYHLAWETRFSHGLAAVCWEDENGLRVVRKGKEELYGRKDESLSALGISHGPPAAVTPDPRP